jgi:hypothetical protein
MILFASPPGHARHQAQGIIGVPACVPDSHQWRRSNPERQTLPAEPLTNPAVVPGTSCQAKIAPSLRDISAKFHDASAPRGPDHRLLIATCQSLTIISSHCASACLRSSIIFQLAFFSQALGARPRVT